MKANTELQRRAAAWKDLFGTFGATATHAVTLACNNVYGGTASVCYQITSDGECIRLPMRGVPVEPGVNRLPVVRQVPLERLHGLIRKIHYHVDRKLYGSHFHRLPANARSSFLGCVEHPTSNVHVHLLWSMPLDRADDLAVQIEQVWLKETNGFGTCAVKPIRDDGWATYACKDYVGEMLEADPLLFVASENATLS